MQALALCLLAYATLDHNPGAEVMAAVQQRVVACALQFDTQAIANCLWALALLQALPPATWNALVGAFVAQLDQQQRLPGEAPGAVGGCWSPPGGLGRPCAAVGHPSILEQCS